MKELIFIFLVLVFQGLSAQPKLKSLEKNDPVAEKYLKDLKMKLENLEGYKLNFTSEITDADQKKQTIKGSYLGSKNKYELEMPDTKTINDGKTQWTIFKKEKEINIAEVSRSKKLKTETPIDIVKNYSSMFKYRVKEPISNYRVIIELVPLNKNTSFFKVDLKLDIRKNQIVGAKLYDRGGHRILFTFTDMVELYKLPEGAFRLNIASYKDYEVLDMR